MAEKDGVRTKEHFLRTKVMTFHPLLILQVYNMDVTYGFSSLLLLFAILSPLRKIEMWVSASFLFVDVCCFLLFGIQNLMLNQPLETVHMPKLCFNLFSSTHPPNPQIINEKYWICL